MIDVGNDGAYTRERYGNEKGHGEKGTSSSASERKLSMLLKCINVVMLGILLLTIRHFRPHVADLGNFDALEQLRKEHPLPVLDPSLCVKLTPEERTTRLKTDPRAIRLDKDPVFLLTDEINELVYFEQPKILLVLTLKAGSVALMTWLYKGVTGRPSWDRSVCGTYVQNMSSWCWKGYGQFLFDMPLSKRWELFTSDEVMRVGLQREPYGRLISAFKSKYTCETDKFQSDTDIPFAHQLREQARVPAGRPCMELREFAMILDRLRMYNGDKGVSKVTWIESHIRPIDLRHDIIDYDVILESRYLVHDQALSLLYERLPFRQSITPYVPGEHTSGKATLDIPKDVEHSFRAFANLSNIAQPKNCRRP